MIDGMGKGKDGREEREKEREGEGEIHIKSPKVLTYQPSTIFTSHTWTAAQRRKIRGNCGHFSSNAKITSERKELQTNFSAVMDAAASPPSPRLVYVSIGITD